MAGQASAPVMGILEMARSTASITDVIASSSSANVLGEPSVYSDPICEGLRRMIEGKAPLFVRRELIPGNSESVEVFDIRDMLFNRSWLEAHLAFRLDIAVPESGIDSSAIVDQLGRWVQDPLRLDGTFAMPSQ